MPPGFVPDGPVPTPRSSNVLAAVGLVADPAPPGFVPDGPVPIPRSFKVFAPVGFVADLAPPGFAAATATADRPRTRLATTYRDNSQRCLSTIARRLCFPSSDRASESADEVNASRTLLHRAVRQTNGWKFRPATRSQRPRSVLILSCRYSKPHRLGPIAERLANPLRSRLPGTVQEHGT